MATMKRTCFLFSITSGIVCFSLFLAFNVSVLGLLGCQETADDDKNKDDSESTEGSTDTDGAPFGRLRVSEGKLLDENGDQVVLKGLGLGDLGSVKAQDRWNEDYFADARDWGAELVRLPVNPSTFREDPDQTSADLDDAVSWCQKHELYLIIEYHVTGNANQGLFQYGQSTTWEEVEDFWATVAPRYADMPTVAFGEIYNEPASMDYMGGSWEFNDWSQHADALIAVLREHAPDMIPLVAGLDFAYDFSPGLDEPFTDADIALSVHPYPGQARGEDRSANWDAAFGYLSDQYPIILTEIGFDPYDEIYPAAYLDDLPYGREILSYAEEKQISWTAFVFFNDPGVWPMPLFSDWETLTPTVSGLFFKDVLAGKDIETAGDGFGERPDVEYPESNGPSDLYWVAWEHEGASFEWIEEPSAEIAAVHIEAEGTAQAGMFASFSWDNTTIDASAFNEIVIQAAVAERDAFSVTFGRNEGHAKSVFYGCSWNLVGKGESTYTVDLLSPDWCGPETCYDLQASGIGFNNNPWSTEGPNADILIQSVELRENPDNPLPESGMIGTGTCP